MSLPMYTNQNANVFFGEPIYLAPLDLIKSNLFQLDIESEFLSTDEKNILTESVVSIYVNYEYSYLSIVFSNNLVDNKPEIWKILTKINSIPHEKITTVLNLHNSTGAIYTKIKFTGYFDKFNLLKYLSVNSKETTFSYEFDNIFKEVRIKYSYSSTEIHYD